MAKKILLMDTLSTIHVGNGALLENTIKLCKDAYGEDCEFNIITMDKQTNELKYDKNNLYNPMFGGFWFGLGKLGKLFWAIKNSLFMILHIINENTIKIKSERLTFTKEQKEAITIINDSDICVSCGGEIIGDTYCQALPFWLFTYWLAIKKGKKFILFPQSVGPLNKKWTRFLVYHSLKNASLLVGRDKPSFDTLISLGFQRDKIMFVPDVAIQQKLADADIYKYFSNKERKIIGITISNPPHHEIGEKVDFVEKVSNQAEQLDNEKYQILIMPSNYKIDGISKDYELCLELKDKLSKKFEVSILENRAYFPDEYISLLNQLELFISTRMHVAILATTTYTPTIAINTQHKIMGYMKNINMEHFCVEYKDLNNIFILMEEIISNRKELSEKLKLENQKLKKEHEVFISRLKDISK